MHVSKTHPRKRKKRKRKEMEREKRKCQNEGKRTKEGNTCSQAKGKEGKKDIVTSVVY